MSLFAIYLTLASVALAEPEMIPTTAIDVVGRTAPPVEGTLLSGEPFSLEATRGKPVILAFWASWCGPCRLELPALSALQAQRPDLTILAVNVDRERPRAEAFLKQVPITLPVVWDNESLAMGQYDVLSMPTTFLLDAQGTVKFRKSGYSQEKGLAELLAAVDAL
jgi:cytochrome c biogenesis protein CcmG/thiol:disulfide interchange protein DsbE